jgi:hypothetical protein
MIVHEKRKLIAIAGMVLVMGSVLPVSAAESLADFDYQTYADTYPDLKAAFGYNAAALYNHYETNGKAEGRVAIFTDGASSATTVESLATFDYKAYADTYPDLKAAFGYDAAALYNHYVNSGKAEGRVAVIAVAQGLSVYAVFAFICILWAYYQRSPFRFYTILHRFKLSVNMQMNRIRFCLHIPHNTNVFRCRLCSNHNTVPMIRLALK